jgi:hypothetical protein
VTRKTAAVPPRPAPTLRVLQETLQAAILSDDEEIYAAILDNSRTTRRTLFGVYRHGYASRLVEVLGNDYELLRAYVGLDRFDELARTYIAAHPSRTQNARWFGSEFPDFLTRHELACKCTELAELASIEKLVADAFDSADAAVLGLTDLVAVPTEDWARLTFRPHPSAGMLRLSTNALAIWKACKDGCEPPPAAQLAQPECVIVWRRGVAPMVRLMPYEEAMMWTEANRGVRFGLLCEMAATFDDPEGAALRAAGYLQGWLTAEMLSSASVCYGP